MERRGAGAAAAAAVGRRLLWALPAYAAGLLGLGAGALLLALALYAGWRRRRRARQRALSLAARLHSDEEAAVRAAAAGLGAARGELPAWVSFPDVERAEWLNKILAQTWPFFGRYMEKLLVESIAPSIRASNTHLQTFTFTKVDMGEKPLRVLGVRAHPGTHKQQILLDLNISYVGDVQIDVEVKKFFCKAGVKGMQLHGTLRVILEPLLGDVPIVGALTMFFIRRPTLDINWTGMTNLLDIPGLSSMSDTMIMDTISSYLVLPNRLLVPLVPNLHDAARLRCPLPRGVVRVHLFGARELRSKDRFMGGLVEGKSDPYAVLRVGTQVANSRVVQNELSPTWDEVYEFIVHEVPGQEIEVELFDKDPDQDDLLGRMKLDFGEVLKARVLEEWFPLQDGGRGRLHLRLEWLTLLPDASKLEQVLQRNRTIPSNPDPPSAAILVVYLDRAEELPMKKPGKEPNPMVQVSVQDVTRESKVVYNTRHPVWEDAFRFFLHDPAHQDLDIQVKDDPRQTPLGSLSVPLSRLLSAPELTLTEPFALQHAAPNSRLHLTLVLRVLYFDGPEDGPPPPTPPGQLETPPGASSARRPSKASPDPQFGTEAVLRIHLLEAEDLIAKDNFLGGLMKGRSDPYAAVRAGGRLFRSRVVREELNPRWNEIYEVVVDDIPAGGSAVPPPAEAAGGGQVNALTVLALLEKLVSMLESVEGQQRQMEQRQRGLEGAVKGIQGDLGKLCRSHGATGAAVEKLLEKSQKVCAHTRAVRERLERQCAQVRRLEQHHAQLLRRDRFKVLIFQEENEIPAGVFAKEPVPSITEGKEEPVDENKTLEETLHAVELSSEDDIHHEDDVGDSADEKAEESRAEKIKRTSLKKVDSLKKAFSRQNIEKKMNKISTKIVSPERREKIKKSLTVHHQKSSSSKSSPFKVPLTFTVKKSREGESPAEAEDRPADTVSTDQAENEEEMSFADMHSDMTPTTSLAEESKAVIDSLEKEARMESSAMTNNNIELSIVEDDEEYGMPLEDSSQKLYDERSKPVSGEMEESDEETTQAAVLQIDQTA